MVNPICEKSPTLSAAGGNRVGLEALEFYLLCVLVIREEEEFIFLDRSTDRATFLITVKCRWRIGLPVLDLTLLVEIIVSRQDVGPEYSESVAVETCSCPTC